jgi:hypothetical protein
MRICLGFFGFARVILEKESVEKVINLFQNDCEIDIYIMIPETLHEFGDQYLNQELFKTYINDIFNFPNVKNINIDFFKYDVKSIILRTKELKLPFLCDSNTVHYRGVSLMNSISKLCKFICTKQQMKYHCYIITRFDIFPGIYSFGDCIKNTTSNNIHIFRTCPYNDKNHAEHRIIITSYMGLEILSFYYDNLNKINLHTFSSEAILKNYVDLFEKLEKKSQDNIVINLSPFLGLKYEPIFIEKCRKLWESINPQKYKDLWIFGDSHANYNFKNLDISNYNCYQTSITMHSFGRDKLKILNYKACGSDEKSIIVYQIGEIDCRCHIGKQLLLNRDLEEITDTLVNNFIDSILENIKQYSKMYIIICCIPPPIDQLYYESVNGKLSSDFPVPFVGTNQERVLYTKKMNAKLKQKCNENDFLFFDYYDYYSTSDGLLKIEYSDNIVHIQDNTYLLEKFKELIHINFVR